MCLRLPETDHRRWRVLNPVYLTESQTPFFCILTKIRAFFSILQKIAELDILEIQYVNFGTYDASLGLRFIMWF